MPLPHEEPEPSSQAGGKQAGFSALGGNRSQLDFDIEFFDRVLERQANNVDVLRCQGQLLARKGCYARAVEIDRRLVRLVPQDGVAHYNLACSLALIGRRREAIAELRLALEFGYQDFAYLETDRDLDSLRELPAFQALLKRFCSER
jgi:tetratricopeptide (TPR) repeat protein